MREACPGTPPPQPLRNSVLQSFRGRLKPSQRHEHNDMLQGGRRISSWCWWAANIAQRCCCRRKAPASPYDHARGVRMAVVCQTLGSGRELRYLFSGTASCWDCHTVPSIQSVTLIELDSWKAKPLYPFDLQQPPVFLVCLYPHDHTSLPPRRVWVLGTLEAGSGGV